MKASRTLRVLATLILLCMMMLGSGCGQKGDLYLPGDPQASRSLTP